MIWENAVPISLLVPNGVRSPDDATVTIIDETARCLSEPGWYWYFILGQHLKCKR